MSRDPVVLCALAVEAVAVRKRGGPQVITIGVGPDRAGRCVPRLLASEARAFVVVGFGGALDDGLSPGDVVVASEIQGPDDARFACAHAGIAAALERARVPFLFASIASRDHLVTGAERAEVGRAGARVVEMESMALGALAKDRPLSVVRVVVDTPSSELPNVMHTVRGGLVAIGALRRVGAAIRDHLERL